ncbi:hypothetical protein HZS_4929, partial [Henneguya salminicola]
MGNIINLTVGEIHLNNEVSGHLINFFKLCITEYESYISNIKVESMAVNIAAIEKVLGCILQLINLILSYKLADNAYLIHHLLLMKQSSSQLAILNTINAFHEELTNITTLINFYEYKFSQLIEQE